MAFAARRGSSRPDRRSEIRRAVTRAPHLILDAPGRGHLARVALGVDTPAGNCWGGDETIVIDGEEKAAGRRRELFRAFISTAIPLTRSLRMTIGRGAGSGRADGDYAGMAYRHRQYCRAARARRLP
jgi:hypothetical protein